MVGQNIINLHICKTSAISILLSSGNYLLPDKRAGAESDQQRLPCQRGEQENCKHPSFQAAKAEGDLEHRNDSKDAKGEGKRFGGEEKKVSETRV